MTRSYGGVAPEQRRAERRERLLVAALDLFTTTGYQQAKIADLCTRAGVSTRNFYQEFASKEQVLLTLHEQINNRAMDRVAETLAAVQGSDAVTRIGKLLDTFVATITADPRIPRLNYVEAVGVSVELEAQHQKWVARWATFIETEACHAAKAGLSPERDYRLTAIALVGASTGLMREWQAHVPSLPVKVVAAELRALMLAGITRPAVP
ncbi:TetR/AcrR family transcriptional regulator [Amycolatopsis sp. H20-H5]|uniref:TetR/AcrR family transcriptional regulator n=1 Tax=Amycolatopsis sp. H20-H5 TaxID=3046309 RepID=UPI002DB62956|nr:TetR/AcrR family transcriptional regulator [Amycolatopsis sp. H20-H5]MEC3979579.1 TetR/AcrR family transcriptional regulator [Amycolatopsis sp. H20-H5]